MTAERAYKNITAQTLDLLREAIVHAEYQPGQKLRIDQLAKSLSVSIGAVREALSRLTAEGLVVAEPNKGFIVAPISRRDLEDLTAVRIEVESTCLEQAIEHGDVDWEGRILSSHHKLRALGNAYMQPGTDAARQWHELHDFISSRSVTAGSRDRSTVPSATSSSSMKPSPMRRWRATRLPRERR